MGSVSQFYLYMVQIFQVLPIQYDSPQHIPCRSAFNFCCNTDGNHGEIMFYPLKYVWLQYSDKQSYSVFTLYVFCQG
jgi:hypothetical protein